MNDITRMIYALFLMIGCPFLYLWGYTTEKEKIKQDKEIEMRKRLITFLEEYIKEKENEIH